MVSECTVKRLGDLSFSFWFDTCRTFMINGLPTILLCFSDRTKSCRSLTRKNDSSLSGIMDFVFDAEFEVNGVVIPDSTHSHFGGTLANYQGFPLILGGRWLDANNKLEMLNTIKTHLEWVEHEGTEYPYSGV